jgi:hypothetical protein
MFALGLHHEKDLPSLGSRLFVPAAAPSRLAICSVDANSVSTSSRLNASVALEMPLRPAIGCSFIRPDVVIYGGDQAMIGQASLLASVE